MTPALIAAAAVAAVVLAAGLALRHWRRTRVLVTVDGESMLPTYADGDRLLVRRTRTADLVRGTVVALAPVHVDGRTDREGSLWFIKRVAAAPGDPVPDGVPALADRAGEPVPAGRLVILGDNAEASHDSREEGFVDLARLRGVVLRKWDREGETG